MVIKGGARGSAGGLATHLQRTDTNERAEVKELRDVAADDLDGALREMEAVAAGTRSKRPLYHASINTDPNERLTPEQQAIAIDRLEAALGLTGQPRAVVEHVKEGREHVHVVWSRIDLEHMRAIPDSHNYRKHEEVARELEREFGHKRVQGAHAEREGVERPERTPSHAEMQQAERTGLTPQQAREQITAIRQSTDSGKAFAAALEQEGWTIARGDRRDFVVIDPYGETHSLARRIEGMKAKDVRQFMADVDHAALPTVEQARDQQRARQVARDELRDTAAPAAEPREIPQEAAPGLPAAPAPELRQETQPEIPAPENIRPLEPDPPRGTAAARGDGAADGITAPLSLASENSEPVADRGADGVQEADEDRRADEPTQDAEASAAIGSPSLEARATDNVDIGRGLERGAIIVLDAAARTAEGLVSFVDGLLGGGSTPPPPASPPRSDVEQIRAQRRALAALEKISESLQQGSTVDASAVRSLTPSHLQQIMLGGDEVLRSLASSVQTERDRDRDWGRERER